MGNMYLLVDVLFVGCGIYVLYAFYLMKAKGEVKENVLMSKEVSIKSCKDKAAYIAYMAPKLLIFGVVLVIVGAVGFADDYFKFLGMGILIVQALGLGVIIYFAVVSRKSVKMFW